MSRIANVVRIKILFALKIACRCWLAISGGIRCAGCSRQSLDRFARPISADFEGRTLRDGDVVLLGAPRGSSAFAKATADKPPPRLQEFLMDRTTRLGEPGKSPPEFAFPSWCGLESLRRCNHSNDSHSTNSAFHQIQIVWVSALMVPELKTPGGNRSYFGSGRARPQSRFHQAAKPICFWEIAQQPSAGTPKIAHVITVDLGIAAQLPCR